LFRRDYYTCSAAIVKLLNVAFSSNNLCFFKLISGFAIGAPRSYSSLQENSFCVSALIKPTNVSNYADFLDELLYADAETIPAIIIRYSPQEGFYMQKQLDERKHSINLDYLKFLDEVETFCGESTEKEREHYLAVPEKQIDIFESYKDTCRQLSNTAVLDEVTSLDELEAAEKALLKAEKAVFNTESSQLKVNDNIVSESAYDDAVEMLRELTNRDPTR
jgi:hypothetical protein